MPQPNPTVVAWMLNEVEADLKRLALWSDEPRNDALIASSRQPFCMDVLPFAQWLQYVLLPNARRILDADGDWPTSSAVATQARRELGGVGDTEDLFEHLSKFDALFSTPVDDAGFPAWLQGRDGPFVMRMPANPSATASIAAPPAEAHASVGAKLHPNEPARLSLAQLPTPIVDAPRLAEFVGVERLLVKRDDLTGLELSGNKIRKLEYLLADAQANGCNTLVTHGGFQSNHCRATAAAGARLGMRVRLFLRSVDAAPERDGNLFLDGLFGADLSFHSPADYNEQRKQIIDRIMDEERSAGRKPYFFPVGASVPLGCWGYVRCISELQSQLDPAKPHDLYIATSSGGTLAGCILGKALFGLDEWRVIGIPVSDSVDYFQNDVRRLLDETIAQFKLDLTPAQTPIELLGGYIGDGYAIPYPAAVETIRLAASRAGLVVDPTYTGKAMHGMLDTLRRGQGRRLATPVFLHTGGAFGLMARRDLFA